MSINQFNTFFYGEQFTSQVLYFAMFTVVQTRKTVRSKPKMISVPNGWILNGKLYWPPKSLSTLISDPKSKADPKIWKQMECKIIGQPITSSGAENCIQQLSKLTDSDDAILKKKATRNKKSTRKDNFTTLYKLQSPNTQTVS